MRRRVLIGAALWAAVVGVSTPAATQVAVVGDTVSLSLPEALERAASNSEEVRLARSQVAIARAQVTAARSQALPQINANLGYTKTLASPFETGTAFELPDSLRFEPNPNLPLEERVRYLEDKTPNAAFGALGGLFGDLPFGQENAFSAYIAGSQTLYAGGRVGAARNIAQDYRQAADLTLVEETAEVDLQVRTAYYQALLAMRLEEIAAEALAQAERFLEQEQLRLTAGSAAELEVLRAEVDRDNLRPQLVEAQNGAQLALLNLKRLVDLPLEQPVRLTTGLEAPSAGELARPVPPEVLTAERAALRAAGEQVSIREQQVRIARGAFLPDVSLSMNYGRQVFPTQLLNFDTPWRTDWTVTLGVSVPVFSGMRRAAELQQAQVELERSRLQLSQLRKVVQLEYEQARGERERARAAIDARVRTAEVAQRVYELTVLRYERGLATQLEVNDARLALLQARTNLAQAIADFHIADAGVARAAVTPAGGA